MIMEKMKSCLWKLQLGFWSYGLIRLLSPSVANVVSRPQTPRSIFFWDFMILLDSYHDSWENEVMFVKIAARVLDLWLDMFPGPKWPKFSFWVLTPRSRTFLRFHDFIGMISWFLRKWGPFCENYSYFSGHIAWYVFWAQVAQM